MGAEYVVSRDPSAAESAVNGLDLDRLATQLRRRRSIADSPQIQSLKMRGKLVPQLSSRAITILWFVLHGAHQDVLHL